MLGAFGFVEGVALLFALLYEIERWLGEVELALLDQIAHIAKKESHDQRADMATVDIGISHNNDLAITQLLDVVFFAEVSAKRRD